MGFLMPKPPKPVKPPNTPILASETPVPELPPIDSSLINTSPTGLKRRASVQRTSLIGG